MRMRSLGKGQSVVFCVPEDVQTKINAQRSVPKASAIEVSHVLVWAVSETWKDLRRSMPIWATQGRRFQNHKDLYHGASTTVKDAEQLLEIEAKSLEAMYRPMTQNGPGKAQFDIWDTSNESIKQIVNRCEEFDVMNFDEANLQEEQERELAHEIEEERQLELPPPMHGEDHRISEGLLELIKHGDFLPQSKGLLPAFRELATCSPAQLFDLSQFPNDLLVTWDFVHTVKGATNPFIISNVLDSYQRPVQWVVSFGPQDDLRLLIISPFEANQLLADIRQSPHVTLHLYAPRTNMAYEPLDDMDLYTIGKPFRKGSISRSSIFQLNLFAGQLYFRSFEEYVELCECLGLAWTAAKDDEKHQADGFVVSSVGKWGLKNSPISFLKVFLTKIRLQCEGIGKTHMGKVVDGTLLEKGEIEEGSMMHYTMTDS